MIVHITYIRNLQILAMLSVKLNTGFKLTTDYAIIDTKYTCDEASGPILYWLWNILPPNKHVTVRCTCK